MYNVVNFQEFLDKTVWPQEFPFHGMLLYARSGPWYDQLHEYIVTSWRDLDALTGKALLLGVIEDIAANGDGSTEDFRPEDVYVIAREIGVPAENLPCLAIFTRPRIRYDMRIIRLGRPGTLAPFGSTEDAVKTALSTFFPMLADLTHRCSAPPLGSDRFDCLCELLDLRWPNEKGHVVSLGRSTPLFDKLKAAYALVREARDWADLPL